MALKGAGKRTRRGGQGIGPGVDQKDAPDRHIPDGVRVERACPARKCKLPEGHDGGVHGRQGEPDDQR